jgi:hypothetical protein
VLQSRVNRAKGTILRILKAITFGYDSKEDRVLAAINPGRPEGWSCWLTRRLTLALIERSSGFLETTSPLAKRATADVRGDLAAFERDAAIVTTAAAMTNTPPEVLKTSATAAELIKKVTISQQGDNFRIELHGEAGGAAAGTVTRAELQRILQMLQGEVAKAHWQVASAQSQPTDPAPQDTGPTRVRH